ncbi:MAG: sulfotransferase [Planctomycetes bacterium]|nr:sulfotransferase [Planctomycetota bacterium]
MIESTNACHDEADVVLILGAARSGSTLLALLLASHPDAGTIGETSGLGFITGVDIDEYRCSCGARIRECQFWQRVGREMSARGHSLDVAHFGTNFRLPTHVWVDRLLRVQHRGPLLEWARDMALALSPAWRSARPVIERRNGVLAEAVRNVYGVRVFVDSSKNPERLKFLLRINSLHSKVVYLVRDGRGTALSYMKHEEWGMSKAANEWRRNTRACERCLATLRSDRWMRIRYEDLCKDPRASLSSVFEFLGLDQAAELPDFAAAGNHVIGNHMRLKATGDVRLDERWKTELTSAQLACFDGVAGDMNRKYGYD